MLEKQNAQQHGAVWTTDDHLPVVSKFCGGKLRRMSNNRGQDDSILSTYVKILHQLPN